MLLGWFYLCMDLCLFDDFWGIYFSSFVCLRVMGVVYSCLGLFAAFAE